jgi:phosphoserine phosphatase
MRLVLTGPEDAARSLLLGLVGIEGAPSDIRKSASGRSLVGENAGDGALLRTHVEAESARLGLDFAFVPTGARLGDYGLIALDMDSTLITIECIDEMADLYGVQSEVAALTAQAMRGEIADFKASLTARLALLAGAPTAILEQVYRERLELSPGATELLAAARRCGLKTLVVSGGFTYFLERLKARLALDFTLANELEEVGGHLSGRVLGPIVDARAKRAMLEATCGTLGQPPAKAIVIGDGANDLEMMGTAGVSVAYHAKPLVAERASQAIRHGGLDVLLEWFPEIE